MAPAQQGDLIKELQSQIDAEEFEKVVQTCEKILVTDSDDKDAIHCKAVALIQCSKYEAALEAMARNEEVGQKLRFEEVYCRYKLRQHEEALTALEKVAKGSKEQQAIAAHLKAQILYRTGDYSQAIAIYRSLIANGSLEAVDPQLLVNLCAAASFSKETAAIKEVEELLASQVPSSSYELAYNLACCMIRRGDAAKAQQLLNIAIDYCTSTLKEEGYSEAELMEELAALRLQLGYVTQILGGSPEGLYQQVLDSDPSDAEMKAVAVNNLASVQRDQKLFKAEKSLQHATSEVLGHKFTEEQIQAFHMNRAIVLLKMNKLSQCKELVAELKAKFGPDGHVVSILSAFIVSKESSMGEAIALLSKSSPSAQVQLCLAQLYLNNNGDSASALSSLQKIKGDEKFLPGIVGSLVALYQQMENDDAAAEALNEALAFWKGHVGSWEYLKLLQAAAKLNFAQKKYDQAVSCYRQLSEVDEKNKKKHIARLVVALSEVDPDSAEKYLSEIPNVVSSEGIDAGALESQTAPSSKTEASAAATAAGGSGGGAEASQAAADGEAVERKRKTKKKKKKRLPKNYDPAVPPDPERWLARRDRSTFKKRRGNRAQRGGHQGGGLTRAQQREEAKKLDQRSQVKEAEKESNAAEATASSAESAAANRNKKGAKKAKKKGRRR